MATGTARTDRARVKFQFKIKGLEFHLEADKDDAPQIASTFARQLGGILDHPVAAATSATRRVALPASLSDSNRDGGDEPQAAKSPRRPRPSRNGASAAPSGHTIFPHNIEAYGFPSQDFNTLEKSLYLLYVAEAQDAPKELSAATIATWFNQHFKSAGAMRPSNVSKYLGAALTSKPAPVGQDATKSPTMWYLTIEGKKVAEQLVTKVRSKADG